MFYEMTIAGLPRQLPICRLNDDLYIAGFVMFGDVEITETAARELLAKAPEFDVIATAESKGIPLAYEMARQSGKPYVVLRKESKLYMVDVIKSDVDSITTDHRQTLFLGSLEADILRGKKVLVVDDVISTGGSLQAMESILDIVGVNIVARMCVLAEGDAIGRDDIIYLEELPLFNSQGQPL